MRVEYAARWNYRRRAPSTPLSEQEARERDARGEEYAVLVRESDEPYPTVVTVAAETGTVHVEFVDDPGRVRVAYRFRRTDERTLFLDIVRCYFYPSDAQGLLLDDAHRVETHTFDPSGQLTHEVQDEDDGEMVTSTYQDIDVSKNWEPVPAFGDWASIVRYER